MTYPLSPLDQLALNIAAAPGQHLLLLGSGVSRSSGIATGWEITLDLIRRAAKVQGEDIQSTEAVEWFRKATGNEPRYSGVLQMTGPTKQSRQQLIRSYFERQATEPEGSKRPTKAHRAIAAMVKGGFIQLIITTNFDRLMESALEEVGVASVVIATPAQFVGAAPLHRNTCTVIKLHGDYLDSEILNIDAELESYTSNMNKLLDRVFDEHGVVACGWSAEYDPALRSAIERRKSRRYSSYWTHTVPLQDVASTLIQGQSIIPISITNADVFSTELESKVQAAASMAGPHPMSEALTLAEATRALAQPLPLISFREIAIRTLRDVEANLQQSGILKTQGVQVTAAEVTSRVQNIIAITRPLRRIFENAVFYRDAETTEATVTCFRSLLALAAINRSGLTHLMSANRAVPMAFHAGVGIAAAASGNFKAFAKMLDLPDPLREERGAKVSSSYYLSSVVPENQLVLGRERNHTPVSDLFHEALREEFRELIPDDTHYDRLFDYYELLVGLARISTPMTGQPIADGASYTWAPSGRFIWRRDPDHDSSQNIWQRMKAEYEERGAQWPPLAAGLFKNNPEIIKASFDAAMAFYDRVAHDFRWR